MKISINQTSKTYKIPVWFGVIKDGFIYKDNKLDWEQTRLRTNIKKYLRDEEYLQMHLEKWAEERGF